MLVAFALALAASCQPVAAPRGQIVLYVTVDAPLPAPPGKSLRDLGTAALCPSQSGDLVPLFDSVQFDVIAPNGSRCPSCSRRFAIDCDIVDSGRASIGIPLPIHESGWQARVRIFRNAVLFDGEPLAASALDTIVPLPPVAETGIVDLTVRLSTEDVGQPKRATALAGKPPTTIVGTWAPAQRTKCTGTGGTNEVCVPGGAYWMGNPDVVAVLASVDANRPKLVVLSPFWMDTHEVTVGEFRASGVARAYDPQFPNAPTDPFDAGIQTTYCTYTGTPLGTDDFPTNCLTWAKAREYCMAAGKDLGAAPLRRREIVGF